MWMLLCQVSRPDTFHLPFTFHPLLIVFLFLKNVLAVVPTRQHMIDIFFWGYPCYSWHGENLSRYILVVKKIEPLFMLTN